MRLFNRIPAPVTGHALALTTILVWGSTFTCTKTLIGGGLDPVEIMFYRFLLAYAALWVVHPRTKKPRSVREELLFLAAGMAGVTMYFAFENFALQLTTASGVSLLVSTAPLITMALATILWRERLRISYAIGTALALAGVTLVSWDSGPLSAGTGFGTFAGSALALAAALSWALYSVVMRRLSNGEYGVILITRRIFFYGLLTFPAVAVVTKSSFAPSLLLKPVLFLNVAFLGLVASALCYITWNRALGILGPVRCNMYIYVNPLTAVLTAGIFLGESLGLWGWLGASLIMLGLIIPTVRK